MFTDHGIFERDDRDGVAYFDGPAGDFYDLQAVGGVFGGDWYAVADQGGRLIQVSRDVGRLAPAGRLIEVSGAFDLRADVEARLAPEAARDANLAWYAWSDGEIRLVRAPADAWRRSARAEAKELYANFLKAITSDSPKEEVATFQPKRAAAEAFKAGEARGDDVKLLRGVAAKIGADMAAAAEHVLKVSSVYTSGVEFAETIHGAHKRAIDAAGEPDIEASLAAALENAKADYAMALEDLAGMSAGE